MSLQQALQASTTTTNKLFNELQNTSDRALKARERLSGELIQELRRHADIEQKDLLPALAGDQGNADVASDAATTNRDLRAKIDELESLPKGDSSFLPLVAELRKLFKELVKDERKELLPAVEQALSDEETEALERTIEAPGDRPEAEQSSEGEQEQDGDEPSSEAAHEQDGGEQLAEPEPETERVEQPAERSDAEARKGKNVVRLAASQREADEPSDKAPAAVADRDSSRDGDKGPPRKLARIGAELRSVLVKSIKRSGHDSLELGKGILHDPKSIIRAQRTYLAATTRNVVESTKEIFAIIRGEPAADDPSLDPVTNV